MKQSTVDAYRNVVELHSKIHAYLQEETEGISNLSLTELADLAYGLRELAKLADDTRKEATKLQTLAEIKACIKWMREQEFGPIRTQYCTATTDIKKCPKLPSRKKDPEAYAQICEWLGLPKEVIESEEELFRPHWPGVKEQVSKALGRGENPPVPIDEMIDEFRLKIRKTKGIME